MRPGQTSDLQMMQHHTTPTDPALKKKTIIQVWGSHECGRGTTIKLACEELITRFINPSHTYKLPLPEGALSNSIQCLDWRVGFESMGDNLWTQAIHNRLNDLIVLQNCDILICASRMHNDVSKRLEFLADRYHYRILKVTNYRGHNELFSVGELNLLSAQHIVMLVDSIIKGKV